MPPSQPDFGDMMEELKIKRAQRAKEEQARRDELKRQFEEKKRKDAEALAKEMEVYFDIFLTYWF